MKDNSIAHLFLAIRSAQKLQCIPLKKNCLALTAGAFSRSSVHYLQGHFLSQGQLSATKPRLPYLDSKSLCFPVRRSQQLYENPRVTPPKRTSVTQPPVLAQDLTSAVLPMRYEDVLWLPLTFTCECGGQSSEGLGGAEPLSARSRPMVGG